MVYTREILNLAIEMGVAILENGGEIYRVEDTIKHILKSYEISDYHIYVISNGIFASANEGREDATSIIRHVPNASIHLIRIEALNQLSREICNNNCSVEEAWERLEACRNLKSYDIYIQMIACGIGCAGFGVMFGGGLIDALITFLITFLLRWFLIKGSEEGVRDLMLNIAGSFFLTAASFIMLWLGISIKQDIVVIGSIFALVPGVKFTTSIRDLLNADYLSGVIHMIDALIGSVEIAVGVGCMFAVVRYFS